MQRLIYGIVSLAALIFFFVFALPVFLIIAILVLVLFLLGLLTGHTSFRMYRSRPGGNTPPPSENGRIIDITEDQDKK